MTLQLFKTAPTLAGCVLALGLTACATVPSETFYTLQPTPTAITAPLTHATPSIVVGPVTLPALVDRAQWVVRQNNAEVRILEQQRWASPLDEEIAQAIAAHITALTATLAYAQTANSVPAFPVKPTLRVQVNVIRFNGVLGSTPGVDDQLQWSVSCTATSSTPIPTPQTGLYTTTPGVNDSATVANTSGIPAPASSTANLYLNMALAHTASAQSASKEIAIAVNNMLKQCPQP